LEQPPYLGGKEITPMADDWTFWLQVMNCALVGVTLLAALSVVGAVGVELLPRWRHKAGKADDSLDAELQAMLRADTHTLSVTGLGLTMADGGERVEPSEANSSEEKLRRK
jgi:hypothetical protein